MSRWPAGAVVLPLVVEDEPAVIERPIRVALAWCPRC